MAKSDSGQGAQAHELVAYLDGELDATERAAIEAALAREPALRRQLHALEAGGRPFKEAYDALLQQAPQARLAAILDQAEKTHAFAGHAHRQRQRAFWRAIAAGVAIFVAGLSAGYGLHALRPSTGLLTEADKGADAMNAWRQVIASQLALYTPQTLSLIGEGPPPPASELRQIGQQIGLDLTPERLALPNLQLKQARLLAFRGVPFAQLIYLDPRHGPVAFCIFASGVSKEPKESERRDGMNLVYWAADGLGFMLVGSTPEPELEALAEAVTAKLPAS